MNQRRIKRIKAEERAADASEKDVEAHRWEAARLIVEELDSGTTQAALAKELGQARTTVTNKARTWRKYGPGPGPLPQWHVAYEEVNHGGTSRKRVKGGPVPKPPKPKDGSEDDDDDEDEDEDDHPKPRPPKWSDLHYRLIKAAVEIGRAGEGLMDEFEMSPARATAILAITEGIMETVNKLNQWAAPYDQVGHGKAGLRVVKDTKTKKEA